MADLFTNFDKMSGMVGIEMLAFGSLMELSTKKRLSVHRAHAVWSVYRLRVNWPSLK